MRLIEALGVALSTYSVLPVPQFEWNEGNMKYAICFFPAVGLLCGGALLGWNALCGALAADGVLFAAVAACLPLLVTGGIHMDGYMDTVDALASHQSRERKLEILKDPHCGAFAPIYCGVYLLLSFGLFHALYGAGLAAVFCPAFVLSRALSALCAVTTPSARGTGMLCAFTRHAEKSRAVAAMVLVGGSAAAGMALPAPLPGGLGAAFGVAAALCCRGMAVKQFGGMTGDTAGFLLQTTELLTLAGIWIGGLF